MHADDVVDFLKELRRSLGGPLTVLWDRGPVHNQCRAVKAYLAKHSQIVAEDVAESEQRVIGELVDWKSHPELLASFVKETELSVAACYQCPFGRAAGNSCYDR